MKSSAVLLASMSLLASCQSTVDRVDSFQCLDRQNCTGAWLWYADKAEAKKAQEAKAIPEPQPVVERFGPVLFDSATTLKATLAACDGRRKGGDGSTVVAVDAARDNENVVVRALEPLGLVTVPGAALFDVLRWFVMEDFDSLFEGERYESFVAYDKPSADDPEIGVDDEIEIYVEHLLVDNFTGGRWRDSLGGDGEELTLQVSINGLTDSGSLPRDDTQFLIESSVKLRDPVLTLLAGNERGAKLVAKYNELAGKALTAIGKLDEIKKRIEEWRMASVEPALKDPQVKASELVAKLEERLRAYLESEIAKLDADDPLREPVRAAGEYVISEVTAWARRTLDGHLADKWMEELAKADSALKTLLSSSDALVKWASRYSIDEQGLLETMQVVQGLAAADRLTALSFDGIRPKLLGDAVNAPFPFGGTAARLLMRGPWSDSDSWYVDARDRIIAADSPAEVPGLVYRGKLRDVAPTGDAAGLTLSTLLLELDDDEIVKVLRYAQSFVSEGASIGGGSTEFAAGAILDAASIVAEKIAQNDVELKSVDLRFLPKSVADKLSGSPGARVFSLRPCRAVVARNLAGTEFGAVAVIRIKRPDPKPASPAASGSVPNGGF